MVVPSTVRARHRVVGARGALARRPWRPRPGGSRRCPSRWGSGVRSTSSAALAPASEPAWESSVFETPSRRPAPPGRRVLRRQQRHRVLVAGVADALVAHARDPRRGLLAEVVALAERLDPARLAVAVRPDHAAAAQTGAWLRRRQLRRARARDRALIGPLPRSSIGRPAPCRGRARPVGASAASAACRTPRRSSSRRPRARRSGDTCHRRPAGLGRRGRHTSVQLRTAFASLTSSHPGLSARRRRAPAPGRTPRARRGCAPPWPGRCRPGPSLRGRARHHARAPG